MKQSPLFKSSLSGLALLVAFVFFLLLPQLVFFKPVLDSSTPFYRTVSSGHNMKDMSLKLYKDAHLEWTLKSDQAQSFENGEWSLNNVKGRFVNTKGDKIIFNSDKGQTNFDTKSFSLVDNVRAKSTLGYFLETDSLNFDENAQKQKFFRTEDKVKIYNVNEKLEVLTTGMVGQIESGNVDLLSEVSCKKSVKNYKDILIQSDVARFTSSLKGIRFKENLRVSQENFKIKGDEAYFIYDEVQKNLKSVQIDGDILASDGLKTAMSDSVEMRTTEDVIIFQGNPRIRMGKNEMIGQEILITNKQKNIQVIRGNIKSTKQGVEIDE